ncbi:MAG: YggS family pyridoxal phosphate-dependent enzyme [Nitrospirota bacterium]
MSHVSENMRAVLAKLEAAAKRAGREHSSVRLVAVTKTVSTAQALEAVEAGAVILGENRVQEALLKMREMETLKAARGQGSGGAAGAEIEWHLIGSLQKNKARQAVGEFKLIHSLDSLDLAREIDRQAVKRGIIQKALLEINIASEETKLGIRPEEAPGFMKEASRLENLKIIGLMCVPPFTEDPESSRPYFKEMNRLAAELTLEGFDMTELSMGMTQDYEVAAEEGATLVRVGTAIFGERDYGSTNA